MFLKYLKKIIVKLFNNINNFYKKIYFFYKNYLFNIKSNILLFIFFIILIRIGFYINIPYSKINIFNFNNLIKKNKYIENINYFNNFSIFALNINSYFISNIIINFLIFIFKNSLKKLNDKKIFNFYLFIISFILNIIQSIFHIIFLKKNNMLKNNFINEYIISLISMILGSTILVWISEKINYYIINLNSYNLLLIINIINNYILYKNIIISIYKLNNKNIVNNIIYLILLFIILYIIVFVEYSEKRIYIIYPNRYFGIDFNNINNTYIPIKINILGINPFILISNLYNIFNYIICFLNIKINNTFLLNNYLLNLLYFIYIYTYIYIYMKIIIKPKTLTDNIYKSGAFIKNIKPGLETNKYINNIINKISFICCIYINIIYYLFILLNKIFIFNIKIENSLILIFILTVIEIINNIKSYFIFKKYDFILKKMNLK